MLFSSYSDQLWVGRMMNRGSILLRGRKFIPFLKAFRPALGSFQPQIEGVLEGTFPVVKGREQPYPLHSAEESFGGGARHFNVSPPLRNTRIFCETKTITLRYTCKQYFLEKKRRSFRMSHKYAVSVLQYRYMKYGPWVVAVLASNV
jgi:hypothetical protein